MRFFNKDKNSSSVAKDMFLSVLCRPASMLINFIYIPIALQYLGVEKYGVWSTILSILSWIGYMDIGIGNGLRNKLTSSIALRDEATSKRLISSTYAMLASIMLGVMVIAGVACIFVPWESIFGVSSFDENLTLIVVISLAFVAVNFVLSICKNVLFALQKAYLASLMEVLVQLINLAGVLVAAVFFQGNLLLMACIYGGAMILSSSITSFFLYKKKPELKPSIGNFDFKTGASLTNLGLQFFVIQICALVLFTTDNLIISNLYGASNVTPYTTVNKLFNVIATAFTALLAPIWSSVTKAKSEKNYEWMNKLLKRLLLLMIPFIVGAIVLGTIFKPVSKIWLGVELDYQYGLIVLGVLYCLLTMWCNAYAYFANGLELMKPSMIVAVIQAIVNIPLSLFFAEFLKMGSAGVLAGTVSAMAISAAVIPIYVHRHIHQNMIKG